MLTFGELVKKARKELNISQEQLARELYVSFSTVNRWENEKSKPNNIAKKVFYDFCKDKEIEVEEVN
ncbi:helix-turn-helix domain-containing protein [Clostridium sporogenes]